ncbi:MAG: SDR family oxidoreductase [Nitrospinota bacterium]|nr:MAG: SDR family oxidoreductase [Nitrospinota bacterium]
MGQGLQGTVVMITGASSGIGWATAKLLAQEGARVALMARSQERLRRLADEIRQEGGEALPLPTDVADREAVQMAVEEILKRWQRIDILINNAGQGYYAAVQDIHPKDFEQLMAINLYGALNAIQAVLPHMERQGRGHIVNISSVVGRRAIPFMGAYCATKFALNALTEALRVEVRKKGIWVTLVAPGRTDTPFFENARASKGIKPFPRQRGMSPEAVARHILRACLKRKREVNLTFSGKLLIWLNVFCPSLVDLVLGMMFRRTLVTSVEG